MRGGDKIQCLLHVLDARFNPRPRARGRQTGSIWRRWPCSFNPRPRARGRLSTPRLSLYGYCLFQSTPPCEGATWQPLKARPGRRVSIHAPVRGGDWQAWMRVPLSCFNPRPRARGRHDATEDQILDAVVSIHAPVRGGDGPGQGRTLGCSGFNPRPRARGRRITDCLSWLTLTTFQSTPPCEGATVTL